MPSKFLSAITDDDSPAMIRGVLEAAAEDGDTEAKSLLSSIGDDDTKLHASVTKLRTKATATPTSTGNSAGTSPERKLQPWEAALTNKDPKVMAEYVQKNNQSPFQQYINSQPQDSLTNRAYSAAIGAGEAYMPGGKLSKLLPTGLALLNFLKPMSEQEKNAGGIGVGANVFSQLVGPKFQGVSKGIAAAGNLGFNALTGAAAAGASDANPAIGGLMGLVGSAPSAVAAAASRGTVGKALPAVLEVVRQDPAEWKTTEAAAKWALSKTKKTSPDYPVLEILAGKGPMSAKEYFSKLMEQAGLGEGGVLNNSAVEAVKPQLLQFAQLAKSLKNGAENLTKNVSEHLLGNMGSIGDDIGSGDIVRRLRKFSQQGDNRDILDVLMPKVKNATQKLEQWAEAMDTRKPASNGGSAGVSGKYGYLREKLDKLPSADRELRKYAANTGGALADYFKAKLDNPLHGALARAIALESIKNSSPLAAPVLNAGTFIANTLLGQR